MDIETGAAAALILPGVENVPLRHHCTDGPGLQPGRFAAPLRKSGAGTNELANIRWR